MARPRATSRDPEEFARATEAARLTREAAASEVAALIAEQVAALIVEGDIMGGPSLVATRLRAVATARAREDSAALRAAWIDLAAAAGACVAALDYRPPSEYGVRGSGAAVA